MKVGDESDSVLARIFGVLLHLPIKIRNRESFGQLQTAEGLDPRDDLVRRGVHVRAAAVLIEFEFFASRGDGRQHGLGRFLASRQRRGRDHAPHDDSRIEVPGLRMQANLDCDSVLPHQSQRLIEFPERAGGKRTCRLEKHFEHPRASSPDQRIRAPCRRPVHEFALIEGNRRRSRRFGERIRE